MSVQGGLLEGGGCPALPPAGAKCGVCGCGLRAVAFEESVVDLLDRGGRVVDRQRVLTCECPLCGAAAAFQAGR